jgi:hypothetical protein
MAQGRLESWNLETGAVAGQVQYPIEGGVATELRFAPLGSHLLVLHEERRWPRCTGRRNRFAHAPTSWPDLFNSSAATRTP